MAMIGPAMALLFVGRRSAVIDSLLILLIVINVHPVFLQRYNRIRILRVISRRARTRGGHS
jgi:hypothetical protein